MYRVIRSVLIFSLVAVFVGCEYWNKDMLGYLEYWSETVQMGKVEVSDATIQKNDAGADTIPVAATPTIAAYVINPQSYELLAEIGDSSSADKSVRVSDSAVQSKAQVVAHEPTLLKVQLGSADGSLEHTEFRVDFEAIRKDTMQSSGKVIGVTLRYNTPPVAPIPLVKTEGGYTPPPVGQVWEADRDGTLYWAYDDSITEETDPNCAKWFSINGTRHLVEVCKVKSNEQVDGLSVFQFKTNYGSISVAAVDSEGVSSPAVASGQAVPPATYVIKYDANGADGGTAPVSQNKTQYTDITLATNSGGLTRIGYRFTGWNTNKEGTGTTYPAGATYSADAGVTLYAQWEAVDAVDFTLGSSAVNHGDTVTLTPPKSDATIHYQIGGASEMKGNLGQSVTVTLYNGNYVPQDATGAYAEIPEGGSVTLTAYAKYADGTPSKETTGTYSLNQYAVRYVGNGNTSGAVPAEQTFYSGGSVTVQGGDLLTKEGYTFTVWLGDDGNSYFQGDVYDGNENLTLTAQWGRTLKDSAKELSGYISPHAPSIGTWKYVEFGYWPQTVKAANVTVYTKLSKEVGMFTYYLGDDDEWYVEQGGNYYKVEPIVWRVLTDNYNSTGNALLLAEKILTGGIPYYVNSNRRTIGSQTVYANNWQYSTIRAWLNGSYEANDTQKTTYTDKGFLQTAFTANAQSLIAATTVDNSEGSTCGTGEQSQSNPYACGKTKDKIFLLSQQEATTLNSGFAAYNKDDSTRIRVTTDYAKATGAFQNSTDGYGGWWWLRSPYCSQENSARVIISGGGGADSNVVHSTYGGVVPALSISLGGN